MPQRYDKMARTDYYSVEILAMRAKICRISQFVMRLHIHLNPIHLKNADITELADFVGIEEFHASCAFVEVVFEVDAAMPVLDCAVACPKGKVDWFGGCENFS